MLVSTFGLKDGSAEVMNGLKPAKDRGPYQPHTSGIRDLVL